MNLEEAKEKISIFENKLNLSIEVFQELLEGHSIKVTIAGEEVICRSYEIDLKNRRIVIAFYHPNLTSYRTYDFKNYGKDWFLNNEK